MEWITKQYYRRKNCLHDVSVSVNGNNKDKKNKNKNTFNINIHNHTTKHLIIRVL